MSSKNISQSNQQRYLDTMTTVTLKDVCSKIGSGFTPKGGNSAYSHTGVSLIRSQNVLDITFSTDGLAYINEEIAKTMDAISVQDGDVLLNITGDSVARVCIVPKEVLPARVNQHVCIIRADKRKINPHYILYRLYIDKEKLVSLSDSGATRKALTKKMIENYEFDIPPISYQNAVVSVIHSISSKIDTNNQINRNLADVCQTEFDKLFKSSNSTVQLFELAEVCYGKDHKCLNDGPFPVYGSGGIMRFAERPLYDGKESVLIPRKGSLNNIMFLSEPFWSVDTMFYTKMKSPHVAKYLYYYLKRQDLASMNAGSAVPSMTTDILNEMDVPIPDDSSLVLFDERLEPMFEIMHHNKKENTKLAAIRDYILPKLMSGEIDVSKLEITN